MEIKAKIMRTNNMELEVKRLQKVMQNKILMESLQFCPKAKDGPQRLVFTRPYPQTRPKDGLHPSKPNPVCKGSHRGLSEFVDLDVVG